MKGKVLNAELIKKIESEYMTGIATDVIADKFYISRRQVQRITKAFRERKGLTLQDIRKKNLNNVPLLAEKTIPQKTTETVRPAAKEKVVPKKKINKFKKKSA